MEGSLSAESWASLSPLQGAALVASLAAVENVIPVLPGDVSLVVVAWWTARNGGEPAFLAVAAVGGNVLGAAAVYAVAWVKGPRILASRWGRLLVRPGHRAAMERWSRTGGWWAVSLLRAFPGIRAAVPLLAGVARASPVPVLVTTAVVSAAWYGTLAFLAGRAGADLDALVTDVRAWGRVAAAAAGVVAAGLVWVWWRKRA